ncbi:MAG: hypothetical protein WBM93_03425, partial [Parasphingorhabdus sp.]
MRWLSGSSMAAAAFLLASAPQPAQAQALMRAPGMMIENAAHGNNISIPRPDLAQNQPHNRAPDFHARDIRISSPLSPLSLDNVRISAPLAKLPNADIRISAPIERPPVSDIRISAPVALPDAYQPQNRLPDFNAREVRISSPVGALPVQDIRISSP